MQENIRAYYDLCRKFFLATDNFVEGFFELDSQPRKISQSFGAGALEQFWFIVLKNIVRGTFGCFKKFLFSKSFGKARQYYLVPSLQGKNCLGQPKAMR